MSWMASANMPQVLVRALGWAWTQGWARIICTLQAPLWLTEKRRGKGIVTGCG